MATSGRKRKREIRDDVIVPSSTLLKNDKERKKRRVSDHVSYLNYKERAIDVPSVKEECHPLGLQRHLSLRSSKKSLHALALASWNPSVKYSKTPSFTTFIHESNTLYVDSEKKHLHSCKQKGGFHSQSIDENKVNVKQDTYSFSNAGISRSSLRRSESFKRIRKPINNLRGSMRLKLAAQMRRNLMKGKQDYALPLSSAMGQMDFLKFIDHSHADQEKGDTSTDCAQEAVLNKETNTILDFESDECIDGTDLLKNTNKVCGNTVKTLTAEADMDGNEVTFNLENFKTNSNNASLSDLSKDDVSVVKEYQLPVDLETNTTEEGKSLTNDKSFVADVCEECEKPNLKSLTTEVLECKSPQEEENCCINLELDSEINGNNNASTSNTIKTGEGGITTDNHGCTSGSTDFVMEAYGKYTNVTKIPQNMEVKKLPDDINSDVNASHINACLSTAVKEKGEKPEIKSPDTTDNVNIEKTDTNDGLSHDGDNLISKIYMDVDSHDNCLNNDKSYITVTGHVCSLEGDCACGLNSMFKNDEEVKCDMVNDVSKVSNNINMNHCDNYVDMEKCGIINLSNNFDKNNDTGVTNNNPGLENNDLNRQTVVHEQQFAVNNDQDNTSVPIIQDSLCLTSLENCEKTSEVIQLDQGNKSIEVSTENNFSETVFSEKSYDQKQLLHKNNEIEASVGNALKDIVFSQESAKGTQIDKENTEVTVVKSNLKETVASKKSSDRITLDQENRGIEGSTEDNLENTECREHFSYEDTLDMVLDDIDTSAVEKIKSTANEYNTWKLFNDDNMEPIYENSSCCDNSRENPAANDNVNIVECDIETVIDSSNKADGEQSRNNSNEVPNCSDNDASNISSEKQSNRKKSPVDENNASSLNLNLSLEKDTEEICSKTNINQQDEVTHIKDSDSISSSSDVANEQDIEAYNVNTQNKKVFILRHHSDLDQTVRNKQAMDCHRPVLSERELLNSSNDSVDSNREYDNRQNQDNDKVTDCENNNSHLLRKKSSKRNFVMKDKYSRCSFDIPEYEEVVYTEDHELQQKIDFEIKMRDGTAKLLAASRHPAQLLEAAKNLHTSNTRMIAYMSELQKRKTDQVMQQNSSGEIKLSPCTATLSLSNLRVPLMWKDTDYFKNKGDHRRFAVFCLLKIGTEIYDTTLVKDVDRSMPDVTFEDIIVFNNIPSDFEIHVEVYSHRLCDDLSMASTPKKIKKKINEISSSVGRSVGRRLSGLREDPEFFGHMIVGPKFECIADATLTLNDVKDNISTYDLTMETPSTDVVHTELPLFGNFCCRLSGKPKCLDEPIRAGNLCIKHSKETCDQEYWATLKAGKLNCMSNNSEEDDKSDTPTLTIPVNKETQVLRKTIDDCSCLEITDRNFKVKTKYNLSTDNQSDLDGWHTALKQHILDHESWQHVAEMKMHVQPSSPQRVPVFMRNGAHTLYENSCDSPMTLVLKRLNVDPKSPQSDPTERNSGDINTGDLKPNTPVVVPPVIRRKGRSKPAWHSSTHE